MALVEGIFTDIPPLTPLEKEYDIAGPLSLVRDGRWLGYTVLGNNLKPAVEPVTQEWIQTTNKLADEGNAIIRDAKSSPGIALIEPTNNARLAVVNRFGWTQPGGLFAEVAAQDTLGVRDLPKCEHLFEVLRILFACTGARIMEPLVNDMHNNPDKPPALAYKSPVHLKVQLGILLKAEIPSDDIGHILIEFPGLFSQRIQSRYADEALILRARTFLDTGRRTTGSSAQKVSNRTDSLQKTDDSINFLDAIPLDDLTTRPLAKDGDSRATQEPKGPKS